MKPFLIKLDVVDHIGVKSKPFFYFHLKYMDIDSKSLDIVQRPGSKLIFFYECFDLNFKMRAASEMQTIF